MVYPSKNEIIKSHPLFESLTWWEIRSLSNFSRIVEIKKGQLVLKEGEIGNSFYIVISGRCEAYTTTNEGAKRILDHFYNGDSFGEMSLLADNPNWCTVRAINDTLLLKLKKESFDKLVQSNAELNRKLSQKMADRMHELQKKHTKDSNYSKIITFGSATEEIGKTLLGINAAAALQEETNQRICLVDFSRHKNDLEISDMPTSTEKIEGWIDELSNEHPSGVTFMSGNLPEPENRDYIGSFFGGFMANFDYVFVILPEGLSSVELEIYEQSDEIYLLTNKNKQTLYQTSLLINQLEDELGDHLSELEIILSRVKPKNFPGITGIKNHLDQPVSYRLPELENVGGLSPLKDQAFIIQNPDHRYSLNVRRIARHIGDISVGLALGAGAARGLSHIGVIKMLEEEGILVDVVAGTSIGSLIAAGWGTGANAEEMKEFAYEFKRRGGLWNITDLSFPPTQSVLRDTRIEKFLDYMLGDATFSDTEFPVRISSSNLDTLEETVITEGLLKEAVRASISIPFLFPPEKYNEEIYVDGGVINPIPVKPLINQGVGRIIAVNPIPPVEVLREGKHSAVRDQTSEGFLAWLWRQVFPFGKNNIIDVFMRSLQTMQSRLASSSSSGADIVINPTMSREEWFEFEEVDSFIRQGEITARQHLDEIKELLKAENYHSEIESSEEESI